jgi:ribosomal protein S1/tetratricopeptide (TPR) repeat protein
MGSTKTSKRKNSDIKPSAETLIPLEEEAIDFPRGGASVLSQSEIDEARAEADAKFEAEQRGSKKRKKTKPSNAFDDGVDALFQGGISGKLPKIVKSLRLKSLSTGMKLWGVIAEVNSKDLVISLPGGLRGIVTAYEASDSLSELQSIMLSTAQDVIIKKKLHKKEISESRNETGNLSIKDLFTVGQLVPCVVCKLERGEEDGAIKSSKKIWLSLRLSLLHKGLTIDAVQEGMVMMACVKSVEDHGYVLSFGLPSFSGFLPHGDKNDGRGKLKKGQLVQGVVSGIDRVTSVISMKLDPMSVTNNIIKDHIGLSVDLLVPGTMVNARVQAILHSGLLLSFLTYFTGTVDIFHLQDPFPSSNWQEKFSENARLKARILYVDPLTKAVGLTLNPHLIRNKVPPMGVKLGEIFDEAQVVRVDRGFGFLVELPSKPVPTPGYVNLTDASDDSLQMLEKKFKEGSKVRARVLSLRFTEGIAVATLKASVLEQSVFYYSDVKPGMVVQAKVTRMDPSGAVVKLSSGLTAFCPVQHMSEFSVAKPSKKFKVGAKLQFRVLGCDSLKRISVTHKKTLVTSKFKAVTSYDDAVEGLITHGSIEGIASHGCFVKFYNSVKGYAHRSELGIDAEKEVGSAFHIGQIVRCRILRSNPAFRNLQLSFIISTDRGFRGCSVEKVDDLRPGMEVQVDEENKRISLDMKESYFVNKSVTGVVPYKESVEEEGNEETVRENSNLSSEDDREYKKQVLSKENDEGETKDLAIDIFNSLGLARAVESRVSVPPLEVNFDTEANVSGGAIVDKRNHLDNEPSEMGSKDDEKLTKRAKKKLKEKRELEIRAAEQKRLEGGQAPDSVDEYEQLVRASPNSSFVWIKYMAFLLSIADVEKARAIAERALQTINFREEEEKLNVWVAFFNLENVYGIPPNEAVLKVFQRALQYCDPKKVHLALLGMYERTGQQEMADQLLKAMTKKFKTSAKVWLRNMQNLLKQGSDAAEMVLNRALVSLPRHKHIKFISRAAVLEFKIGSAERARLLFEGVLRNYPKRTDLWSVYLDQEICRGDASVIRSLFERVTCLDLPPKKMKFLFKKYLDYEKSKGEESRIEYVKKKAMEFVNSKLG